MKCATVNVAEDAIKCLLLFAWILATANSTIIQAPQNMVIVNGESPKTINLPCKSDCMCNLRWSLKKNHVSESELLYNGYALRSDAKYYCSVITDEPGKICLDLANTVEAAQTYVCLEPGSLAEVSADVIWLSGLNCIDGSTEDLVNLTCSIEFRGNWAPTMEWKEHNDSSGKVLSVGVKTTTVPNQLVTSTLVMQAQDGSRNYTCITKFSVSGKPNFTTAANVPNYNRNWTSSAFAKSQDKMTPMFVVIPGAAAAISLVFLVPLVAVGIVLIKKKREKEEKEKQKAGQENSASGLIVSKREDRSDV